MKSWCIGLALQLVAQLAIASTWIVETGSQHASDRNPGTEKAPLKTIGEAMRRLKAGDTVVVGDGVYRERVEVPRSAESAGDQMTVIRARNKGQAVIRGSEPVRGWVDQGGGRYAVRWKDTEPTQVFIDGEPLRQIGGTVFGGFPLKPQHELANAHSGDGGIWPGRRDGDVASLEFGDFFFDRKSEQLVVRTKRTPEVSLVEVSVRPYLFVAADARKLHVQGLNFEHSSTSSIARHGAVTINGAQNVVDEISISHVDAIGLQFVGKNNILRRSTIQFAGQMGLNARGRGMRVEENRFLHNNTRGFNKWWEAGGVKIIGDQGLHDSAFSGNVFAFNRGDGLWVDWMNTNIRIDNNIAAFNSGFGIHFEASQGGVIRDNASYGNGQRGIYIFESSDVLVENNVVVGNGLEGIVAAQGDRWKSNPILLPRRNQFKQNVVGWNRDIQLMHAPDGLEADSDFNTIFSDGVAQFRRGWGSAIHRPARGLQEWRERTGFDVHSTETVMPMPKQVKSILASSTLMHANVLRDIVVSSTKTKQ